MKIFWIPIIVAAVFLSGAKNVSAQGGDGSFSITPFLKEIGISDDQKEKSFLVEVANNSSSAVKVKFSVADFGSMDGTGGELSIDQKYSLAPWISLEKSEDVLGAGEKKSITVRIANADTLSPGGHYGMIAANFESIIPGKDENSFGINSNINLSSRVVSLVFLRKDGGAKYALDLSKIEKENSQIYLPESVKLYFKNGGNVHVVPRGIISVSDPLGREISRGVINNDSSIVLPESSRMLPVDMRKDAMEFMPGKYRLSVQYRFDGKEDFATQDAYFFFFPKASIIILVIILIASFGIFFRWFLKRENAWFLRFWNAIKRRKERNIGKAEPVEKKEENNIVEMKTEEIEEDKIRSEIKPIENEDVENISKAELTDEKENESNVQSESKEEWIENSSDQELPVKEESANNNQTMLLEKGKAEEILMLEMPLDEGIDENGTENMALPGKEEMGSATNVEAEEGETVKNNVCCEPSGAMSQKEEKLEPLMEEGSDEEKKESHAKVYIAGIIIAVLVLCYIYGALFQSPISGEIKTQPRTIEKAQEETFKKFDADYFSFQYPSDYIVKFHEKGTKNDRVLERALLSQTASQSKKIALSVEDMSDRVLTDVADYNMRKKLSEDYSESQFDLNGFSATYFTAKKDGLFERTAFIVHNHRLIELSFTSSLENRVENEREIDSIIKSIKWNK